MFDVILYEPEIPPNTGNVIRLCANTGARLHLIRPLGFTLEDAQLRRAGLDYREYATLRVHETLDDALAAISPAAVLSTIPDSHRLRLPMRPDNRSLNLSNAVAVVVFEAWRQQGFAGASN